MAEFYEKIIPSDLHNKLKASEIREVKKSGESVMFLMVISALTGIAWAIALIAWLIWMGKFALFVFASFSVVFVLVMAFSIWQIRVNARDIKKLIESLKERE